MGYVHAGQGGWYPNVAEIWLGVVDLKAGIVMPLADLRGGAQIMLLHLLRANKQTTGLDYTVVFLEQGPLAEEVEALGYSVKICQAGKLRQAGRYVSTVFKLYAWLKQEKVSIVMSWMSKAHLYAGPAAFLAKVDAVWFQHGIPKSDIMEKCLGYIPAKAVLCPSQAAMKAQIKITPKLRATVINPAVDLNMYNMDAAPSLKGVRNGLGVSEQDRIVGIVARLQRWKGIHTFLEAAAQVAERHSNVHFVIVGGDHYSEPDYPNELKNQAIQSGITQKVHFVGHQADVAGWLQAFDILVHASAKEPFGMVIIEGMASGKPVIAAKAGGPLEIITQGENGLLVPPGDAAGIALAIERLIKDQDFYNQLSVAGLERVKAFSAERLAMETAELLTSLDTRGSRELGIEYNHL